jgi:tetratricopeptide (TPR) repeat protein
MAEPADITLLDHARGAAGRGDWRLAYELLAPADAATGLSGPALELLAMSAYASGHVDVTIDAWERLHTEAIRGGNHLAAAGAAARVALHLLFDTALLAPIRGWVARAERLLDGQGDTPVHAWLAVVRSYERMLSGDFERARQWARRAIDVGTIHEPTAAALGRVAEARCLILQGDVASGIELLNEAAVAAVSGEIDPLSTGVVYCEVVCAFQAIAQYDLAEQWTQAMERWRQGQPVGSIHGRCRIHRAEILRLRGACDEAEREALAACDELRPYLRREFGWPLTELGRIRLRRGDLAGAETAFIEAQESGWDPQPGLALTRLAQGDVTLALALIQEALDHPATVPSKELPPNSDLRRAPLLDAYVEIVIAAGDVSRAESAAEELARIADAFHSAALKATALVARGRVRLALNDGATAAVLFETAAYQWNDIVAPYESAAARLLLGQALTAAGHGARGNAETAAAGAMFDRLELPSPSQTAAMPPSPPAREVRAGSTTEEHRFCREGDYWSVAFDGRTTRLRDAKGLRHLARLLTHPGREIHALDFVIEDGRAAPAHRGNLDPETSLALSGDAGEMLDRRAKEAYRRRLAEIESDLEEARECGDAYRMEQAMAERRFLARELARAIGLGGRDRRVGSNAERARASVTLAIRRAMGRIRAAHPALGAHLERTIRTGTFCVYLPDPRVPADWRMS